MNLSLQNKNEKLGELLIRLGKITKQDMDDVLKSQKQLDLTGVKKKTQRLGDILIKSGKVTKEQIDNALEIKKSSKEKLGEILVNEGIISQEEMNDIVEKQTGIKTIDLDKYNIHSYEYDEKIYAPLSFLSTLCGGVSLYDIAYNGKDVYVLDYGGDVTGEEKTTNY